MQVSGRIAAAMAALTVVASLVACAPEPGAAEAEAKLPTMAPEQTVAEACTASGAQLTKLLTDAESSITAGLTKAGQEVLQGKVPSFDFLPQSLGDTLDQVQQQVTNTEVSNAIGDAVDAITQLRSTQLPTSLTEVAPTISSLKSGLSQLTEAGSTLQQLCGIR